MDEIKQNTLHLRHAFPDRITFGAQRVESIERGPDHSSKVDVVVGKMRLQFHRQTRLSIAIERIEETEVGVVAQPKHPSLEHRFTKQCREIGCEPLPEKPLQIADETGDPRTGHRNARRIVHRNTPVGQDPVAMGKQARIGQTDRDVVRIDRTQRTEQIDQTGRLILRTVGDVLDSVGQFESMPFPVIRFDAPVGIERIRR